MSDTLRHIQEMDDERRRWVEAQYYKDPDFAHFYDLILNTARIPRTTCIELILAGLAAHQATEQRQPH